MNWADVIGDVVDAGAGLIDDFTFTEEERQTLTTQREGYAAARDVAATQLQGVIATADARRTGAIAQAQAALARANAQQKMAYALAAVGIVAALAWAFKRG